jgi:hypothetical protein
MRLKDFLRVRRGTLLVFGVSGIACQIAALVPFFVLTIFFSSARGDNVGLSAIIIGVPLLVLLAVSYCMGIEAHKKIGQKAKTLEIAYFLFFLALIYFVELVLIFSCLSYPSTTVLPVALCITLIEMTAMCVGWFIRARKAKKET